MSSSKTALMDRGFGILCRFIVQSPTPSHFLTLQSWLEGDAIAVCGLPMLRQVIVALVEYAESLELPIDPESEAAENLPIAVSVLSAIREHYPDASETYVAEVFVRRRLPEPAGALCVAELAVARFPSDWACLCGLAGALRDVGRLDEAFSYAERALAANDADGAPLYDAARAYLEAGRPADGVRVFERLLKLFPDYPDAARVLGLAQHALGSSTP